MEFPSLEILNVFISFEKLEYRFQFKILRWKTQRFHTKRPCQKPILRQIEWGMGIQHGPITKCGVCLNLLYFLKNLN